jgi:hypothetical protein
VVSGLIAQLSFVAVVERLKLKLLKLLKLLLPLRTLTMSKLLAAPPLSPPSLQFERLQLKRIHLDLQLPMKFVQQKRKQLPTTKQAIKMSFHNQLTVLIHEANIYNGGQQTCLLLNKEKHLVGFLVGRSN